MSNIHMKVVINADKFDFQTTMKRVKGLSLIHEATLAQPRTEGMLALAKLFAKLKKSKETTYLSVIEDFVALIITERYMLTNAGHILSALFDQDAFYNMTLCHNDKTRYINVVDGVFTYTPCRFEQSSLRKEQLEAAEAEVKEFVEKLTLKDKSIEDQLDVILRAMDYVINFSSVYQRHMDSLKKKTAKQLLDSGVAIDKLAIVMDTTPDKLNAYLNNKTNWLR